MYSIGGSLLMITSKPSRRSRVTVPGSLGNASRKEGPFSLFTRSTLLYIAQTYVQTSSRTRDKQSYNRRTRAMGLASACPRPRTIVLVVNATLSIPDQFKRYRGVCVRLRECAWGTNPTGKEQRLGSKDNKVEWVGEVTEGTHTFIAQIQYNGHQVLGRRIPFPFPLY